MKRLINLITILLVLCSAPAHARAEEQYVAMNRQTEAYFATVCFLSLSDKDDPKREARFEEMWSETKRLLGEIERAVSVSIPDSDISRFNALRQGEAIAISHHTAALFQEAYRVYEDSGGLYDPTVYPLVDLWGFSPRFNVNDYAPLTAYDRAYVAGQLPLPEERFIKAFTRLVGLKFIELTGSAETGYTLIKHTQPVAVDGVSYQAQLDLGGIAKGYAANLVMALAREHGYEFGHIVLGGSSISMLKFRAAGASSGNQDAFSLGIRKPRAGGSKDSAFAKLYARDTALSSSGDYSHNTIRSGVLYCHIIDPRCGYPVNMPGEDGVQRGIAAVTVLEENAAHADALSTALCVMGARDAIDYINKNLRATPVVMTLYDARQSVYEVVTNLTEGELIITDAAYARANSLDEKGRIVYSGRLFLFN